MGAFLSISNMNSKIYPDAAVKNTETPAADRKQGINKINVRY